MSGRTRRAAAGPEIERRPSTAAAVSVLAPFLASVVALAAVFEWLYGSPSPGAPYAPLDVGGIGSAGWTFWNSYLLAYFLHPADGLLPYAPVLWVALAGVGCAIVRFGRAALAVAVAAGAYVATVASTGLAGGFSFPARFLIIVVPLLAVPLAVVLEHVPRIRIVFWPLLGASAAIAIAGVLRHGDLYPLAAGDAFRARLVGVRSIQTAFPDARPIAATSEMLPDWPLSLLWLTLTLLVGALLAEVMRLRQQSAPS